MKSHAAVAAVLLEQERDLPAPSRDDISSGEEFVARILAGIDSSGLSPAEIALLHFVEKVNKNSPEITPDDMKPLYEHGWEDQHIYYAITVCGLFNFYNRWIDATGVPPLSDAAHRQGGKRSASTGYVRK